MVNSTAIFAAGTSSGVLDDAKTVADIAEAVFTVGAVIVGGLFAYYKFLKDRVYRPRVGVALTAGHLQADGGRYLACRASVSNLGSSKIRLLQAGTGLRVSSHDTNGADYTETSWLQRRTITVLQQHAWIEAKETIQHDSMVRIPANETAYLLEARLVLENKPVNIAVYSRAVVPPGAQWSMKGSELVATPEGETDGGESRPAGAGKPG